MAEGLLANAFQMFQGLTEMERRRQADEDAAAQQAVDNAMRQEEMKLREKSVRLQDESRQENLDLRTQIEARRSEDSAYRQQDRTIRQQQAQARIDAATEKMSSVEALAIMKAGENQFKFLMSQKVDPDVARTYSLEHAASLAAKYGIELPQPGPQGFGGQAAQGPLTLSGSAPEPQAPTTPLPNVLPKIGAEIARIIKSTEKMGSAIDLDRKRAEEIEARMAERASNAAIEQQYKKNRNLLQEARLGQMPLETTAKRLGLDTIKLRNQKLRGDIQQQGITQAISRLKLEKDRNSPTWTQDAKEVSKWLDKEFTAARMMTSNAYEHLTDLKEQQKSAEAMLTGVQSLVRRGVATPQDLAQLDMLIKAKSDRELSMRFYQSEYDKALADREGFRRQKEAMLGYGLGGEILNSSGTPDKRVQRAWQARQPVPSSGASGMGSARLKDVDMSKFRKGQVMPVAPPNASDLAVSERRNTGARATAPALKTLDRSTAQKILREAGNNPNKAREIARKRGYKL